MCDQDGIEKRDSRIAASPPSEAIGLHTQDLVIRSRLHECNRRSTSVDTDSESSHAGRRMAPNLLAHLRRAQILRDFEFDANQIRAVQAARLPGPCHACWKACGRKRGSPWPRHVDGNSGVFPQMKSREVPATVAIDRKRGGFFFQLFGLSPSHLMIANRLGYARTRRIALFAARRGICSFTAGHPWEGQTRPIRQFEITNPTRAQPVDFSESAASKSRLETSSRTFKSSIWRTSRGRKPNVGTQFLFQSTYVIA